MSQNLQYLLPESAEWGSHSVPAIPGVLGRAACQSVGHQQLDGYDQHVYAQFGHLYPGIHKIQDLVHDTTEAGTHAAGALGENCRSQTFCPGPNETADLDIS